MVQFLKDNKSSLEKFGMQKREKYFREPWMLKVNPSKEHTIEIEVEGDQSGN
tara:strand:- start:251 stop:406 length:156 start_codon:yes stop_codon:yes gene_type:complete